MGIKENDGFMNLVIDIGNSNVVLGIRQGEEWNHKWRLPTVKSEDAEQYYYVELGQRILEEGLKASLVEGIILSSVVPNLREVFLSILDKLFDAEIHIVGPDFYDLLGFKVPRPYEIGTDLVANAYSAYNRYNVDCIVIDFGTALTFTTVSGKGFVEGVAIAPGIKTAMKALSSNTAQLPEIPLEMPDSALGQNTTHAIQAGILWGYVGMTKELISKIRAERGDHYIAVATGGLSFVMKPLKGLLHDIDVDLTINGLNYMLDHAKALSNTR